MFWIVSDKAGKKLKFMHYILGKMEWKNQPEDYDYQQEVARAAFADMLHDTERVRFQNLSL